MVSKLLALIHFLDKCAEVGNDRQSLRKALTKYKRRMQKHPTRSEERFKKILAPIKGLGFVVNQKIIMDYRHNKGYILDFYLQDYYLAFEIDGKYHGTPEQKQYDEIRTSFLNLKGIKVVRIPNETTKNEDECRKIIEHEMKLRKQVITIRDRMRKSLPIKQQPKITSEEINNAMKHYLDNGGTIQRPHVDNHKKNSTR